MGKVYIIGMGPGSKDYLLPLAKKIIKKADVVIGAPRLLSFLPKGKQTILLKSNYSQVLDYIKKSKNNKNIAVLVSGSPGVFSFSHRITSALKPSEYEVIPGISALQLACARIGEAWDDLCIISLHAKNLSSHQKFWREDLIKKITANKKVMIFCDNKNTPSYAANYLVKKEESKKGKLKVIAFGNLSMQNEEIIESDLSSLANTKKRWEGLWLLLIKKK